LNNNLERPQILDGGSNLEIIMQALEDFGGNATVRELNEFVWRTENRDKYRRQGRAWSEHYVQHDLHYCVKYGKAVALAEGVRYRYYLSGGEIK
jgi:hypothetical protein